jgi:hypothetical protein
MWGIKFAYSIWWCMFYTCYEQVNYQYATYDDKIFKDLSLVNVKST